MMLVRLRFHGRGGEGVKLASRIASRAGFLAGFAAEDSPLYGAERRGAPLVASVRVGDGPIRERGYVPDPDVVVVMDHSLLDRPEAAVLDGAGAATLVLVNSSHSADEIQGRDAISARVLSVDVSSVVLEVLGQHLLSAPMAAFAVKAARLASWEILAEAVRIELAAIGVAADRMEPNLRATRRVFDLAPAAEMAPRVAARPVEVGPLFVIPRLPARLSAPSIDAGATSALRDVSGWRVYRPVIDRSGCTRCFLCFALCPEGAIRLDEERYPVVDYDHCKGCLVCVAECPPRVIRQEREEAA